MQVYHEFTLRKGDFPSKFVVYTFKQYYKKNDEITN
jgi:hypothetical protein